MEGRRPGLQAVFKLLGKNLQVAGSLEDLLRNFAGDLVLAVAIGNSAEEGGHNHLRPHLPHGKHCVIENAVVPPLRERLRLRF